MTPTDPETQAARIPLLREQEGAAHTSTRAIIVSLSLSLLLVCTVAVCARTQASTPQPYFLAAQSTAASASGASAHAASASSAHSSKAINEIVHNVKGRTVRSEDNFVSSKSPYVKGQLGGMWPFGSGNGLVKIGFEDSSRGTGGAVGNAPSHLLDDKVLKPSKSVPIGAGLQEAPLGAAAEQAVAQAGAGAGSAAASSSGSAAAQQEGPMFGDRYVKNPHKPVLHG